MYVADKTPVSETVNQLGGQMYMQQKTASTCHHDRTLHERLHTCTRNKKTPVTTKIVIVASGFD